MCHINNINYVNQIVRSKSYWTCPYSDQDLYYFDDVNKFVNNQYMDAFGTHIHTKYKLLNVDVCLCHMHIIHHFILIGHTPHKNRVGKFFDVKIYTTHIQSLTSSHITWVHITSS